jgi:hypothetical protein
MYLEAVGCGGSNCERYRSGRGWAENLDEPQGSERFVETSEIRFGVFLFLRRG